MRQLGLSFEPQPTAEEEQAYREALSVAMSSPEGGGNAQLSLAQKAQLEQVDNMKHRIILLTYFVDKNQEKAEQKKLALMEKQGQLNAQAAQQTEAAKQQTLQLEAQIKAGLIDKEYQWKFEIEKMKSQGKVVEQEVSANARDRESMRMNETKVGIEQMKKEEADEQENS